MFDVDLLDVSFKALLLVQEFQYPLNETTDKITD